MPGIIGLLALGGTGGLALRSRIAAGFVAFAIALGTPGLDRAAFAEAGGAPGAVVAHDVAVAALLGNAAVP
jgi:hypothetical protein